MATLEESIKLWFPCETPTARGADEFILLNRAQAQSYVLATDLEFAYYSTPPANFDEAYEVYMISRYLSVTEIEIPPFGMVEVVFINNVIIDTMLTVFTDPDFSDECRVVGFAGATW